MNRDIPNVANHATAENPLADLNSDTTGNTETYFFPIEDRPTAEHFIKFMPVLYRRPSRGIPAERTSLANIYLPIPTNLSTAYGANWGDVELGFLGDQIARSDGSNFGAVNELLSGVISGNIDTAKQGFVKINLADTAREAAPGIVRKLVQSLGDASGSKVLEGAQINAGKAINPHLATMFQGVGFRNHNFAFKFVASSKKESDEIKNIIRVFKYCMHPDFSENNQVFEFPHEWLIQFSKPARDYLYTFTPCVLTSMNVSYNGQGVPAFFENTGAPVQIDISLTFKETEIITKNKLTREYTAGGFGQRTTDKTRG